MVNLLGKLITQVFGNPKTTITGIGMLAAAASALAGAYPKVQAVAVAALLLSAGYKFLSQDQPKQ